MYAYDKCPVCGNPRQGIQKDCENCSTVNAYLNIFSGEAAYKVRKNMLDAMCGVHLSNRWSKLKEAGSQLFVDRGLVGFLNGITGEVFLIRAGEEVKRYDDVCQISLNKLNMVLLKKDGQIVFEGDRYYAQNKLDGLQNVSHVTALPNCTGIVYQDGTVEIRGASPLREEIQQWQNVCSLVGGAQHVAALTNDGKVLQAGKPDETVSQWEGVKVLSAVNNDTVALHKNGRVSYDGYDAEKRMAVSQWHDITDIAADSQYIVGLGKDKTIRLAGFCPSMFLRLQY